MAFAAGNILCQIPLGLLADRVGQRLLLAGCGLAGFAGSAAIPLVSASPALFLPTRFFFGGVAVALSG